MLRAVVVTAVTIVVLVMIAAGIGIIVQMAFRQRFCRFVRGALHARIELHTRLSQRHLCAHADAAADQRVRLGRLPLVSTTCSPMIFPSCTS